MKTMQDVRKDQNEMEMEWKSMGQPMEVAIARLAVCF